ncbi:MAG: electron transport complex subunit RsxC [Chitinispirillia bacterium]|nr:electron transport complex subunit RsxC [Chitinispirillia bacterium]MCL2268658.1 electron transport complex subunit RsxC [Chitinispirillia bacterium]
MKKYTFKGGVHPSHCKEQTARLPIEDFPAPAVAVIPLSQHMGAPAKPVVAKGDRVLVGQLIGEPGGNVSAAVHSSISGTVRSIGPFAHPSGRLINAVEIENDGENEAMLYEPIGSRWDEAAPGELVQEIAAAGIVGMGGAAFPTHIKLSPPSHKPIDTLIINGAECEPYLTDDHRIMLEMTESILVGALIMKKILSAKNVFFGIEDNKPDAIAAVQNKLSSSRFDSIILSILKSKYPQGGEKSIITAITRRKVPSGKLPMNAGCVVHNVSTALAIYEAVMEARPLYKRVVTVMGTKVNSPKNLMARIGTPVRALLEACNVNIAGAKKIILGGPMMGTALSDLDAPIIKSTSAILVLDQVTEAVRKYPCVNCGMCVRVCPIRLIPSRLAKFVEKDNFEDAVAWNIMDCIECGSCTYICPAKINLVQYFKLGKMKINAARAAKRQAG